MKKSRLTSMLKHLEKDPTDSFNLYAVALEYKSLDKEKSILYFKKLLSEHPDYIPSYYQLGVVYYELNEIEKSKRVILKGINVAKNANDTKTQLELKSLYDEVSFEE